MLNFLAVLTVSTLGCNALIEHVPLPSRMQNCFAGYSQKTSIVETVGESIASFCFDQYIWRAAREHGWRGFNITREAYTWAHGLLKMSDNPRKKRQAITPTVRLRKEYRRLSEEERANFHRAIQLLKADTTIAPNRYDALSAIHQGIMTTAAHGGPNFLGFHRVYVLMFENALREKVPTVTVPYWDSTLDSQMADPTQSVVFTETFLGHGFGVVNTGPFAHWGTLSGPLIRNIGQAGQLFRSQDIEHIISRVRLAEITEPNAFVNSSLEFLHNQVHLWIDGQMGSLNTAAHDPVFWLHHAYVDYIWELFRRNQRAFGVDPTRDYPPFVNDSLHLPGVPMGLSSLRNIDGFSDMYTSMIYTYEQSPRCSERFPDCGSPYLHCAMRNFRATCVSADRFAAPRAFPIRQNVVSPATLMTARLNLMNAARVRTQMAQMRIASQQQQQQMQQRLLGQMHRQETQIKESENAGIDDASEMHQVQKRGAKNYPKMLIMQIMRNRGVVTDPRGNSFQVNRLNINSNIQPSNMFDSVNSQAVMNNLQNSTLVPPSQSVTCPAIPIARGYQNSFNINGKSDINQWVYIPVKVVYQRPPTFVSYSSYPIVKGEPDEEMDIYTPSLSMKNVMKMGKPASYSQCKSQESGAGKVYITSRGMNYMGVYKEYAIVDHRLAISIATAYVAVKSPELGASEMFLSAYDSCGRICQPYCKKTGNSAFQRCSGAFRVTSGKPKLYGNNYGDAVTNLWQFGKNGNCPNMAEENVYIQFYCNFQNSWPFIMENPHPVQSPVANAEVEVPEKSEPVVKQTTPLVNVTSPPANALPVCNIGNGCVVPTICQTCTDGKSYACLGACAVYASCQNGAYLMQRCPTNMWFDATVGRCVTGVCIDKHNQWWFPRTSWKK